MDGLTILFCLVMIVFLVSAALLILSIRPGSKKEMKQKGDQLFAFESARADSSQMDTELDDLLKSLNTKDKLTAKTKALQAFLSGAPETKKRAIEVLSKLGEVEQF